MSQHTDQHLGLGASTEPPPTAAPAWVIEDCDEHGAFLRCTRCIAVERMLAGIKVGWAIESRRLFARVHAKCTEARG